MRFTRWPSFVSLPTVLGLGALAQLSGCEAPNLLKPDGPGEIDPNQKPGPSLHSFEAGPITEPVLEELRGAACVNAVAEPNLPAPAFEFVIDVSGSMSLTPAEGLETKWSMTRDALRKSVATVPGDASLGVVYFPNKATERNCLNDDGPCDPGESLAMDACIKTEGALPLSRWGASDSSQREAFEDALLRVNPAGGTPTHDALLFGLEQLRTQETEGQRVIVLLTDGQPTYLNGCRGSGHVTDPVDPSPIIETIAEAASEDIVTFVVGAPGSEETSGSGEDARTWLSEAAEAGLTASAGCQTGEEDYCHFDLSSDDDFGQVLDSVLSKILAQAKPCELSLPEAPQDQPFIDDEINVVLVYDEGDGLVIGKSDSEDGCVDGYTIRETEDGTMINLCQSACDAYREDLSIQVEFILGCESAPVLPPT